MKYGPTAIREDWWPFHLRPWLKARTVCLVKRHEPNPYWLRRPGEVTGTIRDRPPDGWVCNNCGQKQPAPSSGS